jgi:hypothetical protein
VADQPDFSDVTIRHRDTGEERTVAKHALPFFTSEDRGWERIDSAGRTVPTTKKES